MINYQDAWFDLLDKIRKLHDNADDLKLKTEHKIYHFLLDDVIPSVLEKQINPYETYTINFEEACFELLDRIKKLHNIAGDIEEEPAHSIYHSLLDDVIPSVLEK